MEKTSVGITIVKTLLGLIECLKCGGSSNLSVMFLRPAKMAVRIKVLFGVEVPGGPMNTVLDGCPDHSTAWTRGGDLMQPSRLRQFTFATGSLLVTCSSVVDYNTETQQAYSDKICMC